MRNEFTAFSIFSLLVIAGLGYFISPEFYWLLIIFLPIILMGFYDMFQSRHAIMRNFPILGRGRYVMEDLRPKLYQYFIESETNGTPISRIFRSIVYQRAKHELSTTPFGTQMDLYAEGYEWMNHSIAALNPKELVQDPRIKVGCMECTQPYSAAIFNVYSCFIYYHLIAHH